MMNIKEKREMAKQDIFAGEKALKIYEELLKNYKGMYQAEENYIKFATQIMLGGYEGMSFEEVQKFNKDLCNMVDEHERTRLCIKEAQKDMMAVKLEIAKLKTLYLLF